MGIAIVMPGGCSEQQIAVVDNDGDVLMELQGDDFFVDIPTLASVLLATRSQRRQTELMPAAASVRPLALSTMRVTSAVPAESDSAMTLTGPSTSRSRTQAAMGSVGMKAAVPFPARSCSQPAASSKKAETAAALLDMQRTLLDKVSDIPCVLQELLEVQKRRADIEMQQANI